MARIPRASLLILILIGTRGAQILIKKKKKRRKRKEEHVMQILFDVFERVLRELCEL